MNAAPVALSSPAPLSDVVHTSAPLPQTRPAIASDGENFLAVWTDMRGHQDGGSDIYATRVDAAGRALDPLGIPIIPTFTDDVDADVVWNGTNYVVVYATPYVCLGLTAVEVSPQGAIAGGRAIVRPACGTRAVSMAWNGSVYLVTWSEPESGVHGVIVDRFFNVVVPGFVIAPLGTVASVASDGAGFLAVWDEGRYAAITTEGKVGPVRELLAGNSRFTVESDGTGYVLARGGNGGVQLTRVSSSGEVLHSWQIETGSPARDVALASDGMKLSIAWQEQEKVMVADLDGAPVWTGEASDGIALARSRQKAMAVWSNFGDIYAAEPHRQPSRVAMGLHAQRPQAAAWNGENYGVLWTEAETVRFGRVDVHGRPLDGAGIEVGRDAIDVSAHGTDFLIAARAHVLRVSRDLTKVDTFPVGEGRAMRVVGDGDGMLAFVLVDQFPATRPPFFKSEVHVRRIGADGRLGELRRISPPTGDDVSYGVNEVVRMGDELWVVLTRTRSFSCGTRFCRQGHAVELVRIGANGAISEPVTVASEAESGGAAVAAGGGTMLIARIEENALVARLVAANGEPLPPRTLIASSSLLSPSVAWDGTSLVVTVEEVDQTEEQSVSRLRSLRLSPDGEVSDETSTELARARRLAVGSLGPFLTAGSEGRMLLLYAAPRLLVPHSHAASVDRVYLRVIGQPSRSRPVR